MEQIKQQFKIFLVSRENKNVKEAYSAMVKIFQGSYPEHEEINELARLILGAFSSSKSSNDYKELENKYLNIRIKDGHEEEQRVRHEDYLKNFGEALESCEHVSKWVDYLKELIDINK